MVALVRSCCGLGTFTDENGVITASNYDASCQQLTSTVEDSGGANQATSQYNYDAVGNCTLVTDALGNSTNYTYDAASRLTRGGLFRRHVRNLDLPRRRKNLDPHRRPRSHDELPLRRRRPAVLCRHQRGHRLSHRHRRQHHPRRGRLDHQLHRRGGNDLDPVLSERSGEAGYRRLRKDGHISIRRRGQRDHVYLAGRRQRQIHLHLQRAEPRRLGHQQPLRRHRQLHL